MTCVDFLQHLDRSHKRKPWLIAVLVIFKHSDVNNVNDIKLTTSPNEYNQIPRKKFWLKLTSNSVIVGTDFTFHASVTDRPYSILLCTVGQKAKQSQ